MVTWWSAPQDLEPGEYCVEYLCDLSFAACEMNFTTTFTAHESVLYHVDGFGHAAICEIAVGFHPPRARWAGVIVTQQRPPIRAV